MTEMIKNACAYFTLLLILAPFASWGSGYDRPMKTQITNITNVNRVDYSGCAATAAMGQIPAISHHADHDSHVALGVAVGGCESEVGTAFGITQHDGDRAVKASIGVSGEVRTYGVGLSFGFK